MMRGSIRSQTRTVLITFALLLFGASRGGAQSTLQGSFHLAWGDPRDRALPSRLLYMLTDDQGVTHRLDIDARQLGGFEFLRKMNGSRVSIQGVEIQPSRAPRAGSTPELRVNAIAPLEPAVRGFRSSVAGALQTGSKPYITILCRFADAIDVTPHDPSYYANWLTAPGYPNLDDYWQELSDGRINLAGSRVVGWYNLSSTQASYGSDLNLDLQRMLEDCTRAADSDVDFTLYAGVNMQFNLSMTASWGGGGVLRLDGLNRVISATWMASWANRQTYGHEIGHSFGLPHSSGPYANSYDSGWDVMSGGAGYDSAVDAYVGTHTIAYHKDLLGWIPAARKYVAQPGTRQTITIERSARPPASGNYLEAEIPISGSTGYYGYKYTVEVRQFYGYDRFVPGEAIIIHRVEPDRDRAAQVVDTDNNGNPNDAGARWLPGMTFTDAAEGVVVRVESRTAAGWVVTIDRTGSVQLTVQFNGTGSVSGDGGFGSECDFLRSTTCTRIFPVNSTVHLTATPLLGFAFLGWQDDCSGTGSCTLLMDRNRSVTANFGFPLVITSPPALPRGITGASYDQALAASGGTGQYSWEVSAGSLPPGLSLSSIGNVSGTSTTAGTFAFTARVTSGVASASKGLSISVNDPLSIQTAVLKRARQNSPYADSLKAAGGTGSYSWTLVGGALPPGLSLHTDGVVSGVPTSAGTSSFTARVTTGPDVATRSFQMITDASLTITTRDTLRNAALLNAYADTLKAVGGATGYAWSLVSGSLPSGLALNQASGVISGTPSQNGTYRFSVRVTSDTAFAEKAFVLRSVSFPQFLSDTTRPSAVRGRPYADTLRASGGLDGAFVWSIQSGTMPPGLALDSATGVISGVPSATGRYRFHAHAFVLFLGSGQPFNISVYESMAITSAGTRRDGIRGVNYADTLTAVGGSGIYTWTVTSGSLPTGLSLGSSTGVLSGSPTQVGTFTFTAAVTSGSLSAAGTFTVTVLEPLVITSDAVRPAALVNAAYADTLRASGGSGTYNWSVASGTLPSGITLTGATGILSGTPGQSGSYLFSATVQSGVLSQSKSLSMIVAPPVAITSDSIRRAGLMGAAYADTLQATGGGGTPQWTIATGSLPDGITLNSTGILSGIAERDGTFRFGARVSAGATSSSRQFVVVVAKPVVPANAVIDQLLGAGSLTPDQMRFLDLLGNRNGRVDVGDVRAWLAQAGQIDPTLLPSIQNLLRDHPGDEQPPKRAPTPSPMQPEGRPR